MHHLQAAPSSSVRASVSSVSPAYEQIVANHRFPQIGTPFGDLRFTGKPVDPPL